MINLSRRHKTLRERSDLDEEKKKPQFGQSLSHYLGRKFYAVFIKEESFGVRLGY